jgi:predicted PurR-regulated permease PerM
MLGVLGGALAYGLLGIFVGPVLLSVAFMLVREWAQPENVPHRRDAPPHRRMPVLAE